MKRARETGNKVQIKRASERADVDCACAHLSAEGEAASVLIVGRRMVYQQVWGGYIVRAEHVELLEAFGLYHLK